MPTTSEFDVLVAGGGVAGLEALMALRDLAGLRVKLTLLSPEADFVFRPMAVAEPFARGQARRRALAGIAESVGAEFRQGALAGVDCAARRATTADGDALGFDALLVAVGAGSEPAYRRALTWTPESDPEVLGGLLRDVEEGYSRDLAFIVPPGVGWSLPAYELALMTAWQARDMGRDDVTITIYTDEEAPLAAFGAAATAALRGDLEEAGVRVETSAAARETDAGFTVAPGDRPIGAGRVVALPHAAPRAPAGLPLDERGFILTDVHGRVPGCPGVWAAGDAISFPVKQGGLAAQQADAAAESIAAAAGAPVRPEPFRPVLRGVLLTGRGRRWIRRDLGSDEEGTAERHALWWPPTKVAGRYLSPFLAELEGGDVAAGAQPPGQGVELDLQAEVPAVADALAQAIRRADAG